MPSVSLTLSRVITGVALLALCPPLAVGAAGLSGIGHRWVDILAPFTGPALIVAVLIAAVGAILRLPVAAGAGVVVSAILIWAGWPQWAPPRGRPATTAPMLTLYSANLLIRNQDRDAVARSIQASDADVLILIETPPVVRRDLDQVLAGYPYRVRESSLDYAVAGTVIASRWPIQALPEHDGKAHVAARVDTPSGPVTLAAVHLTRPWPYQFQWGQITQVMSLERALGPVRGPLIVAGDFNSVSSARIGRQVKRGLNLIPAPGWPGTWPEVLPSALGVTIDQVYRSPDLALLDRRLGLPTGSDHRPVITRFSRAEPARSH